MEMARQQKPISLALDPRLLERLERWIAEQELSPSKRQVFEAALKDYLDKKEGVDD